ncbi:hypothetical protein H4696_000310 [Amycolatopsis lexingtonensis]|uniref:Uncharacterized protein n=1 Tax=Amycolatopsis lexingtonensis TaxID=218822 RepID=A0ABR9HQJ6_9PSEU|nr:hypothetical protein [Amycolatopsis lexingtonensis]
MFAATEGSNTGIESRSTIGSCMMRPGRKTRLLVLFKMTALLTS